MPRKIYISVTVDWEGTTFARETIPYPAENLEGLISLRENITALGFDIPWTHFITPNYWLNGTADPTNVLRNTKAIDWTRDEIGLHVHCWYKLIAHANVVPLVTTPTWNNEDPNSIDENGHGVPLGAYSLDNIIKIIASAKTLLEEQLLQSRKVKGFRCGGWMANDDVLTALMRLGFDYDCSATPPEVFSMGFSQDSLGTKLDTLLGEKTHITNFLLNQWGYTARTDLYKNQLSLQWNNNQAILLTTQPYKIFSSGRSIIEMPNNGGLSDYASAYYMSNALGRALMLADAGEKPVFLNLGCHQEGGDYYKLSLLNFFNDNRELLLKLMDRNEVVFSTVLEASQFADANMPD